MISTPHYNRLTQTIGTVLSSDSSDLLADIAAQYEDPNYLELRFTPASELFSTQEVELLNSLEATCVPELSRVKSRTVVILKATRLCNLRCTYCNSWRDGPGQVMELDILARVLRDTLTAPTLKALDIVWHGGEVTLLKPSFLKRALWIQERYRPPDVQVFHSLQTNATRLTEEWIAFLKQYGLNVGVSIDGPPEIHDARRLTKSGNGSWKEVKRGIDLLRVSGVPFGVLAVIDQRVISCGAQRYLEYLSQLGVSSIALLNVLPPNNPDSLNPTSYLDWDAYQAFMCDLFKHWWSDYRNVFILRELQALVDAVKTGSTGLCLYASNCMGQYLTIEPDGRVSACDKYVGDSDYSFGSLRDTNLSVLLDNSRNLSRAISLVDSLKEAVTECEFFGFCKGGCPHDTRLNTTHLGLPAIGCCGLNNLLKVIVSTVTGDKETEKTKKQRKE